MSGSSEWACRGSERLPVIVVRDVRPWVCAADAPILEALEKISSNREGVVFCVESDAYLVGVLTDGDFRRWIINQTDIDLHQPVRSIANLTPTAALASVPPDELASHFDQRVSHIPLVDERGRLVAVATKRHLVVDLEGTVIAEDASVVTIAEIGINHNGSLELALRLIDEAANAGADCAKFQMRDLPSLYRNEGQAQAPAEDLGTQYTLDLLERFALTHKELFAAFDHCRKRGLVPLCTPWDIDSVKALEQYGMPGYKIASADLTNHDLLNAVASTQRPVLMSTGMSTETEIREAIGVLQAQAAPYVLLHCNSTYPAPFRDVNLHYIAQLREIGSCPVGYSGHERGWHVPVAAVAIGARVVEKHFTIDRTMEGNDHRVSLLPAEYRQMVSEIRQVEEALGSSRPRVITQGELMNRVTLAKSLVARTHLPPGHVLGEADIQVRSPGRGLQPNRRPDLIGRTLNRPVRAGDFFFQTDLEDDRPQPRGYSFRRPWGLPVRFHDFRSLTSRTSPDFVEFHLSYQDMELDPSSYVPPQLDMNFVVHSPDLFRGDHILNLAAADDDYRARSITELQRVIDLTRRLRPHFTRATRPLIVVSMGGFSSERHLPIAERAALYDRVRSSLSKLDSTGVELVAQTLPPFPWYLGGQLHCNLFVDPDDVAQFSHDSGCRLCLDVSHSKLACNFAGSSFSDFVETVGSQAAHLHLVDAAGIDGEGLQIGDGEIDWSVLAAQLDRLAPAVGFIPEIWQGHKNDGEGFWIALEKLEQWF